MKDFLIGYVFYLTKLIRLYAAVAIIEIKKSVGLLGGDLDE